MAIEPRPETWVYDMAMLRLEAAEICPLARTVNCPTEDAEPYVPAVTPVAAILPDGIERVCQEGAEVVPLEVRS
jgi:hypothetical protein